MYPLATDLKPKNLSEATWESMRPGQRLRFVRNNQYRLELSPGQYEALYRLPYWLLYGPEHGVPPSWFNADGLLLPKFQPGGGRFSEFLAWRRRYRSRRWLNHRIKERYRLLRERYKTVYAVGGFIGFLLLYGLSLHLAETWFGERLGMVAVFGIMLVVFVGGIILLSRLQRSIVTHALERRWREREGLPR